MSNTQVFLYKDGLRHAAGDLRGNETIHLGIRPYEMHAGNVLAIIAYPILLCEELEQRGVVPKFKFILSLNDWEQQNLTGENIYQYIFDTWPEGATIQYSTENNGVSTAELWSQRIIKRLRTVCDRYPKVTIEPVFNSQLKNNNIMKKVIIKTINNYDQIKKLLLETTGAKSNGQGKSFASAVCKQCCNANTATIVGADGLIAAACNVCGEKSRGKYEDFSYWLYHKPLFAARWKIFNFECSISGGDHFKEGDTQTRETLYRFYFDKEPPKITMMYSPVLLGRNGEKMSKSRNNFFDTDVDVLLDAARQCNSEVLRL